jgi:pSer/pThr/pTyr-binding forkhead associated (FHA) protein
MPQPLRLRVVSQDGTLDVVHELAGDSALIGRGHTASDRCDVLVERKDISRAHVRVLRGVVVEDLDSTNGTYVQGKRIQGAVVLRGGSFQIGDPAGGNLVTVHVEAAPAADEEELGDLERTLAPAPKATKPAPLPAAPAEPDPALLAELAQRATRIEQLQREAEAARAAAQGAMLQLEETRQRGHTLEADVARLSGEVERAKRRADETGKGLTDFEKRATAAETELARLRGELDSARANGEAHARETDELRRKLATANAELGRLHGELEAARASALAPSLEVEALRRQNAEHVDGLARSRAELEETRARSESTERELAELRQQGLELVRDLARRNSDLDGARTSLLDSQRDLERLRGEQADLLGELARHKAELDLARTNAAKAQASDESQQRIRLLEQRIASLKEELAAKDAQAGAAPQVQLLSDEVARVRARAEGLEQELERTRAELAAARGGAPAPAGPKPSAMASAMIEQLTRRTRELEGELARARGGSAPVAPEFGGTDLRPVVEDLRRQLEEARRAAPTPAGSGASASDGALAELREENRRLTRDLLQARTKLVGGGAAPAVVARSGVTLDTLRRLVEEDSHTHGPLTGRSVEEFLVGEQYLGFRNFERVVTRVATSFQQIFNENTILPGTEGSNYRMLVEALLAAPEDEAAREALVSYVDDLGLWLAASVHAHRRAALRYFEVLKSELSEAALTRQKSISGLGFMVRAELWTRAQQYLARQSATLVEERLEAFAREEANAIVSGRRDGG